MTARPLDGISVVDLTHVLAGPYCTYQLGLLGADVIKVESLEGDMVRGYGGTEGQLKQGLGSGFVAQNAGKRSLSLDITRPEGAEVVMALVEQADILVENFRPGALGRHGFDYDTVRKRNSGLIYVSISAFGHTGPYGHRPGFDDVVQATSGFMSINARGDGPIHTGGPVLDYATGMHAASAILAAILLKQKTGEGQRIDLAMQDVTMLLINRHTSNTASTGDPPRPAGDRRALMLGRFKVKDGYVQLAGYLPRHCRAICAAIGLDEYAGLSGGEFAERADEIKLAVEQKLAERTAQEWDAIFSEAAVVAGGVRDLAEVIATEQTESRNLLTDVETAAGTFRVTTNGYRINDETWGPRSSVPLLGEHSREVLKELNFTDEQIASVIERGIVKQA